ncbi:MAG: hypothetical protein ACOC7S_02725, partial [Planctomycetota bacterium]
VARYDTLDIAWSLSTDGGQSWQEVGTSNNETFITLADPECSTLYRTVAYLATGNAGEGIDEEGEALDKTWGMFSSGGGPANVQAWNEASEDYDRPLHYYLAAGTVSTSVAALLATGDGQCGAWTLLFRDALRANGMTVPGLIEVKPPNGYRRFGVKNIAFGTPSHPEDAPWSYVRDNLDVTAQGIPGQNTETPAAKLFVRHYVYLLHIDDRYYDASYGVTYECEEDFTAQAVDAWEKDVAGLGFRWSKAEDEPEPDLAVVFE